jgi:hypothetical protein
MCVPEGPSVLSLTAVIGLDFDVLVSQSALVWDVGCAVCLPKVQVSVLCPEAFLQGVSEHLHRNPEFSAPRIGGGRSYLSAAENRVSLCTGRFVVDSRDHVPESAAGCGATR